MKNQSTILYINDVEQLIGKNRVTLRRWWYADQFPKPVKLHSCALAWRKETIEQWIDEQMAPAN